MRFDANARIAKRAVLWRVLAVDAVLVMAMLAVNDWHVRLTHAFLVLCLAAYALMGAFRTPHKPGKSLHVIGADPTGLTIDGELAMPHAAIVSASCVPAPAGREGESDDERGPHAVHLQGRPFRRAFSVYVGSAEEGRALMAALRLDPAMSTAHFRALPPWAKQLRWLAVVLTASPWVLINLMRVMPLWGLGLIAALYAVIALPVVLPQRVDVGHDGLFLRWLGNARFIPFSRVEAAALTRLGVTLLLTGGRSVEIRLTQRDGAADAQARALLARVNAGLVAHHGLSHADEEAHLARGARDVAQWVRDMRALGSGELGGYRAAAIPRERLWEVLENAAADRSAREGAALALSAAMDAEERARILALAHRTASPRLRVALDGVGREHDETRLRVAIETAERQVDDVEDAADDGDAGADAEPRRAGHAGRVSRS
jgi:hypothetical protein